MYAIVWPDVGKVDEGVDGDYDAQTITLPANGLQLIPGHFQRLQMLTPRVVELNEVGLFVVVDHLASADGQNRAVMVPLGAYDLHLAVHQNGLLIKFKCD